jgi:hypothetical protein
VEKYPMNTEQNIAFALGGLAGNNYFGAGFLQAALDVGIKPDIISCTSGQIYYVRRYLEALQEDNKTLLEQEITKQSSPLEQYKKSAELLFGMNPFMRPAYPADLMQDFAKALLQTEQKLITQEPQQSYGNFATSYSRQLMSMIPGRTLVPQFSVEFLKETSEIFKDQKEIGIVFNSYDPQRGHEIVYLNEVARKKWEATKLDDKSGKEPGEKVKVDKKSGDEDRTEYESIYESITAQSVMDALWVYQYGFDKTVHPFYQNNDNKNARFDGAFCRQVLLSELVFANKIYVVRPVSYYWVGELPYSLMEIEDLKIETMFNSTYRGEKDKINLINKLIEKAGNDRPDCLKKYREIELIEINMSTQEDYLEYLSENKSLFDQARQLALVKFAKSERNRSVPPPKRGSQG